MSCEFYSYKSGLFSGDYWCNKNECSVSSDTYYKYCRDYNYRECPNYKHQESSGCFITTIICNMLNKKDDDVILKTLRSFRDDVLQKDEKYYNILKEYDLIGPVIADCIIRENNIDLVRDTYQKSIIPIYYLIYHKKYEDAIGRYQLMTQLLIDYYSLNDEYDKIKNNGYQYDDFVPEKAGHGRRYARSIEINQCI